MTYSIHERFIADTPAPLSSPYTCYPGPGQLNFEGTAMSILGGSLIVPAGDITPGGSGFRASPTLSRQASMAIRATLTSTNNGVNVVAWRDGMLLGYASILSRAILGTGGKWSAINANGNASPGGFTYAIGQTYTLLLIMREIGGTFGAIKGGTEYPDWHLLWASDKGTVASQVAGFFNENGSCKIGEFDALYLGGDWAYDTGIAHSIMTSPATGNSTQVPADTMMEVGWVPTANEIFEWFIRHVDDNNTLIVRVNQATKVVQLLKKEAGVETLINSSPPAPQLPNAFPYIVGQPYKLMARVRGSLINITAYDVSADIEAGRNVATETFNQSATGAKVPSSPNWANHIAWPIHIGQFLTGI